jgi:hypothetical protein
VEVWARRAIPAIGAVALFACLAGLLATGLRLEVAGLAIGRGLFVVPLWHSIRIGLLLTAIGGAALAGSASLAYGAATRGWEVHRADWEEIVTRRGVRPAWNALNAPDEAGAQRRAARRARSAHVVHLRRARRHRVAAYAAELADHPAVAQRRRHDAAEHEQAARAQADAVAAHERATGETERRISATPPGERALKVLAGFNQLVLTGVVGLAAGQFVAEYDNTWWLVSLASLIAAVLVYLVLTRLGPLGLRPSVHGVAIAATVLVTLLASPPVGLLLLSGLVISTWGRREIRLVALGPRRPAERSRLPVTVAALYVAVGVAAIAMPPVTFTAVTAATGSAQYIGGLLDRSGDGVHLVGCTPLADATSTGAYLHHVPATRIVGVSSGGEAAFDQGGRPSIAAVLLNLVGVDWPRAVFVPSLRARRPTCAGAPPRSLSAGAEDASLGAGVIAAPGPAGGRAHDGERPIEQTADPRIARLARRYQPTLLVTVADRFWPVSVNAVIADLGPGRRRTCLYTPADGVGCRPVATPPAAGRPTDYLRYPTTSDPSELALTERPAPQFKAFEAGQHTVTGRLHRWLADPGRLDPWRSAELYFFFGGPVHFSGIQGALPRWPVAHYIGPWLSATADRDGLVALEYWFFYPYNYYPLLTRNSLMDGAPIAGDAGNVDLHQGDWEHVDVLLDQRTLDPIALYTARHDDEGLFFPWASPALGFDGGHPVVQAAFGGHPSYPPGCGRRDRTRHLGGLLADWLVCGSGRFAFRADTTPLVDLGGPDAPWACWPGHFGEAKPGAERPDPDAGALTQAVAKYVDVAGPLSPLQQGENGSVKSGYGVCRRGRGATEGDALQGPLARLLSANLK